MSAPPGASPLVRQLAQARQLINDRRFEEAQVINDRLLSSHPEHPNVRLQASWLAGVAGHYRRAREHVLAAFAQRPDDESTLLRLLIRLQVFHLNAEIQTLVRELLDRPAASVALLDAAARTLNQLNQPERAAEVVSRALALHPRSPELQLARAHSRLFAGDFDGAEADIAAHLQARPQSGFAWWLRAKLRRQSPASNHVAALEVLVKRAGAGDPRNLVLLAYALHKELDDLGEYPRAATALDLACRTKRAQFEYDGAETRHIFDALSGLPLASPAIGVPTDRTPIFIVGMHRSGTTLLEQLLGGHSQVRRLGELYDFTSQLRLATDYGCKGVMDRTLAQRLAEVDVAAVGRGYLDAVAWRLGDEPCFIDKLPSNFLNLGVIGPALPQARILHMVRDPMETGFSNLRELFGDNTNLYSYDPAEQGAYHREYEKLMARWRQLLPGRILDVDYARLTRDPEAVLREVSAFCGLAFEPATAQVRDDGSRITTASAVQARGEVAHRDQPKWTPYADYLAPMAAALRD